MTPIKRLAYVCSIGFGSGLSPVAPGTMGTILAFFLSFILCQLPMIWLCLWVALSLALGSYICDVGEAELKSRDHPSIVWDEMAAFWLLLLWIPHSITSLCVAFILFRIFDIFKPWPICVVDKNFQGGWSVMLDDVLASGYVLLFWWVFFT